MSERCSRRCGFPLHDDWVGLANLAARCPAYDASQLQMFEAPREDTPDMRTRGTSGGGLPGSRLAGVDLNLLVSLQALLHYRSVTLAGAHVGLSQPAMSSTLRRLRHHFD